MHGQSATSAVNTEVHLLAIFLPLARDATYIYHAYLDSSIEEIQSDRGWIRLNTENKFFRTIC